ncbi:MAG: TetR/AcrR family transcriptional regulator [Alphaproteobacteria bacterium]|nr:TetR/AcrR family transcriptional regulator [Alphaproteobacteria bacterium]MBU2083163.1 TetR/AcrR family transcriptional regulator [Alphaproteobacteria bacterium]MBU2144538.1 TetR/AcrR family transcriptional regulator [Alphaproteobacteria bacterium]MBU2195447.1 TetR/AcrR family transcriptional regulator [Alphaproteobacteria bacterium]
MKTRDRILQVSLLLFNEEGEAPQTAVDISNALDISPGNLYYHFKGKDAIIRSLFSAFEDEMRVILRGSKGGVNSIEDNWVYLYIILEEIYDFRFFYRDLGVLLDRYPDLAVRFRALVSEKRQTVTRVLEDLAESDVLRLDPRLKTALTDQIMMTVTFWLANDSIGNSQHDGPALIHTTVFQVMCLIVPYMGEAGFGALSHMIDHYESVMD